MANSQLYTMRNKFQMRDNYWDNWKGIAIIAVVSVHVLGQTSSFPLDSFNNLFGVFLRQFVNFCVALFFFLSGISP